MTAVDDDTDRHFGPVARTFTPVTRTDPLHLARLG